MFRSLALLSLFVLSLQGADVFEQHKRLGRGLNMGNSLEAKPEGSWGFVIKD